MSIVRKLMPIAAFALTVAPALAEPITLDSSAIGQSFTLNYNGYSSGTVVDGLTASTTFTLTGVTGTGYTFDYALNNTTSSPLTSRVSGFGFDTDPNISSASSTGAYAFTTLNSSYPNGIGSIDVCFKDANTGSCSGGGSGGLAEGTSGTGSFTLNFASAIAALTLDNFHVRYQSITGAGGISSASGDVTTSSSGGTSVPKPGMLGMMGGAVAALALLRRRKLAPALALA